MKRKRRRTYCNAVRSQSYIKFEYRCECQFNRIHTHSTYIKACPYSAYRQTAHCDIVILLLQLHFIFITSFSIVLRSPSTFIMSNAESLFLSQTLYQWLIALNPLQIPWMADVMQIFLLAKCSRSLLLFRISNGIQGLLLLSSFQFFSHILNTLTIARKVCGKKNFTTNSVFECSMAKLVKQNVNYTFYSFDFAVSLLHHFHVTAMIVDWISMRFHSRNCHNSFNILLAVRL